MRRFRYEIVSDLDDAAYRDVFAAASSVFQTPAFLHAARTKLLRQPQEFLLIGARDETEKGLALFPFVRMEHHGARILQGLDLDVTDYFAPPLRSDVELSAPDTDRLWQGVCQAVRGIDAVTFKKMPRELLGRTHALTRLAGAKSMSVTATHVRVPIDPATDASLASVAREVRRKTKKLQQIGPVAFDHLEGQAAMDAFDRMVELRRVRFSELGRKDALTRAEVEQFYRSQLVRPGGLGHMFMLRAGPTIAAIIYTFEHAGTMTMVVPVISIQKEVHAGSPGLVAIYRLIEWCARQGIGMLDLSVGSLFYKSRFSAETTELYEHAQALTLRGMIAVSESAARRRLRHLAIDHPWIRRVGERFAA